MQNIATDGWEKKRATDVSLKMVSNRWLREKKLSLWREKSNRCLSGDCKQQMVEKKKTDVSLEMAKGRGRCAVMLPSATVPSCRKFFEKQQRSFLKSSKGVFWKAAKEFFEVSQEIYKKAEKEFLEGSKRVSYNLEIREPPNKVVFTIYVD